MNNITPLIASYIATSIDGFIASTDDTLDWLERFEPPLENKDEDYGFAKFLNKQQAVIMGSNTYKIAASAGPDKWPYHGKRLIVLSSKLTSVSNQAEIYSGNIKPLVKKLADDGVKSIYVDGGYTISQFLNQGLLDELIISILPITLGTGIPLFQKTSTEFCWQLSTSKTYSNGLAQLHYKKNPIGQ